MAVNTTCQIKVEAKKKSLQYNPSQDLVFYFRLNPLLFLKDGWQCYQPL